MSETREPCGNEECDRCYPIPRWKVSTERVARVIHAREIKAESRVEALRIYREGTAHPSSYDDNEVEILEQREPKIERMAPPTFSDTCWHDLPSRKDHQ